MLLLFFTPLATIIFFPPTSILLLFGLYILSGLGMAGIGMGVMHDAIHGSFSKNKMVNKIMGYTINLIGANDKVWRLQHNVLHHSYTNIEEHDDDINAPFFLRFSPHAKKNKLHKYQHYYAWFFYGLSTISWVTSKDFVRYTRYYKMGLVKNRRTYIEGILKIMAWKIIYFSYALALPILLTSISPWVIILGFLAMHFVTGLCITLVFQTAHIMPNASFPLPDNNGNLESERLAHQLETTCNYAPNSALLSWLVGGLTNQIEHHLFPNISHIHYRKIAPIVQRTAEEFGLPYHSNGSFASAIFEHFKMLRDLGRMELQPIPSHH
ncbi:acyl-CoA desaturase [Arenibacter sp. ARW7G5Y1]|uniref:fatty acid desaturase family protein n=2 Tax=unclassified Arenibacter TaxID=2615047 RepID=UPI000D75B319|nr:acyl-CoA desaturase [Arenibacter sp. ARW7G5Y1]PXX26350.1 linoleoyl-CoA desaturase [Arenibacter sp. ARW7G5Y1]|tara:strand:- start:27 stop:998 length:972 start_codon:yes stop_codon:yes gene_type:complete